MGEGVRNDGGLVEPSRARYDCHEKTILQMLEEENSKEFSHFSQGDEQMMIAEACSGEDEGKFQSEEQLEEAGIQPAQGEMAEASLSERR
jgi:hypothetical protein